MGVVKTDRLMAKRTFNYDFAAAALVTAIYHGDSVACERHAVSGRTLRRYHERLQTCPELAVVFQKKSESYVRNWSEDLSPALRSGIAFLTEAMAKAASDPSALLNPKMITAVTNALRVCGEIAITTTLINARLALSEGDAVDLSTILETSAYRN
jgi:hypothetical protein